jgi:hypothetical protein
MSEFDPTTATPQEQAARDRSFDVMQWDPTTQVADLEALPTRGVDLRLEEMTPLRVEGSNALLAAVRLGQEKELNIWSAIDEQGKYSTDQLDIGSTFYNPAEDVSDGHAVPLPVHIISDAQGIMIGRENDSVARRLGLPGDVSRKHAAISLLPNGVLRIQDLHSSNGTKVLVKTTEHAS